jgi:hypothetical protein
MEPVENASAEALLGSLKTIDPAERRRHASVLNYWLSIRGDRQFPPIRDLDPLEVSDAGPCSILLEMIGGGEDAEIRHVGQAIKPDGRFERISEVPSPSLLACIAAKLPIIAATREALAFEEDFDGGSGPVRCWVSLLPFSATGAWIDYVYGFVTLRSDAAAEPQDVAEDAEPEVAAATDEAELPVVDEHQTEDETFPVEQTSESLDASAALPEQQEEQQPEQEEAQPTRRPGFSKLFESLAGVGGFYGTHASVEPTYADDAETSFAPESEPEPEVEPAVEPEQLQSGEAPAPESHIVEPDPEEEPAPEASVAKPEVDSSSEDEPYAGEQPNQFEHTQVEGPLQNKLTEVRFKAEEARLAKLRSEQALYEGLGAAYDFALEAEEHAEEYLKLVEAQGLRIQLRSPMQPVVKLAFDGTCDEPTIRRLEAVLAWALKRDLPKGSLPQVIEDAGGLDGVLEERAEAA